MKTKRSTKARPASPFPLPRSKYQIFPAHPAPVHERLKTSIAHHGVENPTVWDDEGNLLDGWERKAICEALSTDCPREVRDFGSEAEKFQFILAVNSHRRPPLNRKQKQAVIEAYLQGDPDVADNMLGDTLGVSKNTVAAVRRRLEASRQIRKVKKTRGKDGKLRPVKYTKRIFLLSCGPAACRR
jgi:ParB-like chromosome segregation protein Spo0J